MIEVGNKYILQAFNDGSKDPAKRLEYKDRYNKHGKRTRTFRIYEEVPYKREVKEGEPKTWRQWYYVQLLDDTQENYNVGDEVKVYKIKYVIRQMLQVFVGIYVEPSEFEY